MTKPTIRRLRIFARDPSGSADLGETVLHLPYEELRPGPDGRWFEVRKGGEIHVLADDNGCRNLDHPKQLAHDGFAPAVNSDDFKAQMVYAVACETREHFRHALGREPIWAGPGPLTLRFDFTEGHRGLSNAYYVAPLKRPRIDKKACPTEESLIDALRRVRNVEYRLDSLDRRRRSSDFETQVGRIETAYQNINNQLGSADEANAGNGVGNAPTETKARQKWIQARTRVQKILDNRELLFVENSAVLGLGNHLVQVEVAIDKRKEIEAPLDKLSEHLGKRFDTRSALQASKLPDVLERCAGSAGQSHGRIAELDRLRLSDSIREHLREINDSLVSISALCSAIERPGGDRTDTRQDWYQELSRRLRSLFTGKGKNDAGSWSENGPDVMASYAVESLVPSMQRVEELLAPPVSTGQEIRFGKFRANDSDLEQAGAWVSTALMRDVVVHETTHALLDGLRPTMTWVPNAESWAFHEAFADLVAIFSRFADRQLIEHALRENPLDMNADLIVSIGHQFGFTATAKGRPLRSAIAPDPDPASGAPPDLAASSSLESPHTAGNRLVSAIFAAFRLVFRDKNADLVQVIGARPDAAGLRLLAARAGSLGQQFLHLLIRAVDYLPPLDIRFGDYLRALITADRELVPDDVWRYRARLVEQFRRYRVAVRNPDARGDDDDVLPMHETSLAWTELPDGPIREDACALQQKVLAFSPEATALGPDAGKALAKEIEGIIKRMCPERVKRHWGLQPLEEGKVDLELGRYWNSRIVGPDGKLKQLFGLELIQSRRDAELGRMYGGCTLLFEAKDGDASRGWLPTHAIYKRLDSKVRKEEQLDCLDLAEPELSLAWESFAKDDADSDYPCRVMQHLHLSPEELS